MTTTTDSRIADARRYANKRGLTLSKARGRDAYQLTIWPDSGVRVDALVYLRDQLRELDPQRFGRYLATGTVETGHPLTLAEVEAILDAPTVRNGKAVFTNAPLSYKCSYRPQPAHLGEQASV